MKQARYLVLTKTKSINSINDGDKSFPLDHLPLLLVGVFSRPTYPVRLLRLLWMLRSGTFQPLKSSLGAYADSLGSSLSSLELPPPSTPTICCPCPTPCSEAVDSCSPSVTAVAGDEKYRHRTLVQNIVSMVPRTPTTVNTVILTTAVAPRSLKLKEPYDGFPSLKSFVRRDLTSG